MQADLKEGYLRDVKVPLKRFSEHMKDKKWLAGDTVGLAECTCRSCAISTASIIVMHSSLL